MIIICLLNRLIDSPVYVNVYVYIYIYMGSEFDHHYAQY